MPMLNSAVQIATKPFPKAISPRAHAVIDYLTAGAFFMSAAWFWKRNKRAAIGALVAGGAELTVSLLTNYPGGVKKVIDLRTHRDIDFGLGAMTASMPEFLAFKEDEERKLFLAQGAIITGVNAMTRFPERATRVNRKRAA